MLSLYLASEISFPQENIMREAKTIASKYLMQVLEKSHELKDKTQILTEVGTHNSPFIILCLFKLTCVLTARLRHNFLFLAGGIHYEIPMEMQST